jgi:hypothetical protein
MAHLIDDETVAKMGHPDLDVGHPAVSLRRLTAVFGGVCLLSACVGFVQVEGDFTALESLLTAPPQEGATCVDAGR